MSRIRRILMYDFERSRVEEFLKKHKPRRAAVQLPAGLKPRLREVVDVFEKAGVEPVAMGGVCYGACDLAVAEAKRLGCDVLVHYGHSDMGLPAEIPTLYVEARVKQSPMPALERAITGLKFKRVGLVATVQFIGYLEKLAELLRSRGFEPVLGEPGPRTRYPGQVLGCDLHCVESIVSRVDGYLYLGTGRFHPMGVALATGRDVVTLDLSSGQLSHVTGLGEFLGPRKAMIARAALAEKFGVVVSTKQGQTRLKLASGIKTELEKAGRKADLVAVDEVTPESLNDFRFDAIVCVACPRIPIDDAERFEVPVLTPFEARVMLGRGKLEPYILDQVKSGD